MNGDSPDSLPLADAEAPGAHVSTHAVLVHAGQASFDDGALHGWSAVEAGVAWAGSRDDLAAAERWGIAWVAVTHEPGGSRGYAGIVGDEIWIDAAARLGFPAPERRWSRIAAAVEGLVDLGPLEAGERAALRAALIEQDPDAWDRAGHAVRDAFEDHE